MTRRWFLLLISLASILSGASLNPGDEIRFCLRAEPKTFHPLLVADEASETIRYLTGGVLIRVNRLTQTPEPALATSWKVLDGGRRITFQLRKGVAFSDGTPFSAEDVAFTVRALMDPALHSPTGDSFRSGAGEVKAVVDGGHGVSIVFPAPVAGLERLFDQVAILSARSPLKERAVLGPFRVVEHKAGAYVRLERNSRYWKKDEQGRQLPYVSAIVLDIQPNREVELLRFRRNELDLINALDPEMHQRLSRESPAAAKDAGPSLESEMMWFNQSPGAPLPANKKAWFTSREFRRAVSSAINRADICRIVYLGRATPAVGPISPANKIWFNSSLAAHPYDPNESLRLLTKAGFRRENGVLRDKEGMAVEFSVITNAGNKSRERMAAMIQDDLSKIGIRVNIAALDFPSLIERISRTYNYEACLLGMVNIDLDPNSQMNIWLSSASNHQWNPNQKSPVTAWEAEIDRLMRAQAAQTDIRKRKAQFDRVQEIVWDQSPFLYLITKNALSAVGPRLAGVQPAVLYPQTYWNIEKLQVSQQTARRR